MGRLIVILLVIGLFILWRRWRNITTEEQKREFTINTLAFSLIALIAVLAIFGRIDILGAIFVGALVSIKFILGFLIRNFPLIAQIYGATKGAGLFKKRTIKTDSLHLEIDFKSQKLSGEILAGPHTGKSLELLSESQLKEQISYCKTLDTKAAYILQTYLIQKFGQGSKENSRPDGSMTREEALNILGLSESPSAEEIKKAHRSLIQKMHPDRGGNDFLAALINRARETLEKQG